MLWILSALACILGILGLVFVAFRHSPSDGDYDLGSVSRHWMDQHRTDA
jgi:hypothetical protein